MIVFCGHQGQAEGEGHRVDKVRFSYKPFLQGKQVRFGETEVSRKKCFDLPPPFGPTIADRLYKGPM